IDAVTQGKFFALGQCKQYSAGEICLGGEATAPFRCRNLMSHRLLPTLPGKKNIIGCAPSRKSFGNLSSAMAYAGRMRKAVETAYVHRGGGRTGLKAGVNVRVCHRVPADDRGNIG